MIYKTVRKKHSVSSSSMFGINDCHKPKINRKLTYAFRAMKVSEKRKKEKKMRLIGERRNYLQHHRKRYLNDFQNIILFPHDLGQTKHGVDRAPVYLHRHFCKHLKHRKRLRVINVVTTKNNMFLNLQRLYEANARIIKEKKINIGGDHSMSIATISDSINQYHDCKVIYFDAHADINTYQSSHSKHYHGMPLSFVTGIDKNEKGFPYIKRYLPLENLLYIGSRCWDTFERNLIYRKNIRFIDPLELNNDYANALQKILDFVDGKPIHLSFDVDCMDKSMVPSTGTAVYGGIQIGTGKQILSDLKKYTNIINVDITELNLSLGTKKERNQSAETTMELFQPYLCFDMNEKT